MKVLVTGGAGFIGRWVVGRLLQDSHQVWTLDNLANGCEKNLEEYKHNPNYQGFVLGDIKNRQFISEFFNTHAIDLCYHMAASINVQDSIDDPTTTFENDTIGTFHVLEACKKHQTRLVFMSTCMVYDKATDEKGITELSPTKPASPYAGSKISAENMVMSYWYAYGLPVTIVRPFNTYGPFQKSGGEGGVVAIFIKKSLAGETLNIYGDGTQTRDLLYVEDCAEFVVQSGYSNRAIGEIMNAGLGKDITINDLAFLISGNVSQIKHIEHIHPQSEIKKLLCNYSKAQELIGWYPKITLEEGIQKTKEWIMNTTK